MNVSVHGAKTQLSKLLDLVEDGEEVVIERHGRPVAQLVAVRKRRPSALGAMRGQFKMAEGTSGPPAAFALRAMAPRKGGHYRN
jgi:prevent-host-death family protein